MGRQRGIIALLAAAVFLMSFSGNIPAVQRLNTIQDIRFQEYDAFTRIVVECQNEVQFSHNLIKFPDRLYFDFGRTMPGAYHQSEIRVDDPAVGTIRVGRFDSDTVRVVIGLKSYADFNIYRLADPPRLVVEINHEEQEKEERFIPRSRVVVIDPGHGGRDPGAIGRRGLREKDVVLDIAKELKKILEGKFAVKAYLTRDDDSYLDLKERTAFANNHRADLFVSVHVNASPNRKTKGVETWFLNIPSNDYDLKVAARENAISEEKMRESQSELGLILTSLARGLKCDESLRLANYVQNSLVKHLGVRYKSRIEDHGVKYTLFYVLVDAEMPAILVETGFITNPEEELMLRKSSYRNDIAFAIAKGLNSYLSTLPDLPKLAKR